LTLSGYLFVLPSLLLFLGFVAGPVGYALYISFNKWTILKPPIWLGLANYRRIVHDDVFFTSLKNTVVYTLLYVPAMTTLALLAALAANRKLRGLAILKALIFVPAITPSIIVGVVWLYIYDGNLGLLNALLRELGMEPIIWLGDQRTALLSLVVASVWQRFGWFMVLFLAGLQDIPLDVKEAAALDGASAWQSFRHVTVPLLRPVFALVLILGVIGAFQVFDLVFIMTGGGPVYATHTLSYYIYQQAFTSLDMGYAAAMSYVFFLIMFGLTVFQLRILRPATES
jgi:ABC-type sugar transport system permease subunit